MKNFKFNFNVLLTIGLCTALSLFTVSCDDDEEPKNFELSSATIGTADLNGATFATDVDPAENIVVVFTDNVDETTATSSNITLMRGTTAVATNITVSGNTITVDPVENLITGTKYDFTVSSAVDSKAGKTFGGLTTSFTTEGVGLDTPPQAASQVLYLQLNGSVVDVTGNATKVSEQVAWTTDRFGTANGAADFRGAASAGTGDIIELSGSKLVNASTTFSVWFKINTADYDDPNGSRTMFGVASMNGYFFEVGSGGVDWMKFPTQHKVAAAGTPDHNFGTAWTDFINGGSPVGGQLLHNFSGQVSSLVPSNVWHQMVLTYDASSSLKTFYIDGVKIMQADIDKDQTEWILKELAVADKDDANNALTGIDPKLALGFGASKSNTNPDWMRYSAATNTYKGAMDDFRIFDKALTESEVLSLYNSEKP